jgi:hypothetical protein
MDAEIIRQRYRAAPFRPFSIVLNNGKKLPVDQPYYLMISEDGRLLVHSSLDGFFEKIAAETIREIEDLNAADYPEGTLGPPKYLKSKLA